jgi:AraC-like DNA-binding protein
MRVLPFRIPKADQSAIHLQIDDEPYFYDKLHQHPERQLTVIEKGEGTLIYGDFVGRFAPGDVFLMGSNVPHVFRSDEQFYAKNEPGAALSRSIFFDWEGMGTAFTQLPEFRKVNAFLAQAEQGGVATGKLASEISDLFDAIFKKKGVERFNLFMTVLDKLSRSKFWKPLSALPNRNLKELEGQRLDDIFQFTMTNYQRPIALEELADLTHMNKAAFCRYFKQHTRKTYVEFLNEYRVNRACSLLLQPDRSVASVAYEVGFNNLSHFNRKFKTVMNQTPKGFIAGAKG